MGLENQNEAIRALPDSNSVRILGQGRRIDDYKFKLLTKLKNSLMKSSGREQLWRVFAQFPGG
jgi:hypothetical protein